MVRAAVGVCFKHKLGHLVLMTGKIDALVKLQHELANFVMSLANFERRPREFPRWPPRRA